MPITRYGHEWPDMPTGNQDLMIELICFRDNLTPERGGLGKPGHFRNIVKMLWGKTNKQRHFVLHPWAEDMLEEACQQIWLWLSGCASSGKTDFGAVWGIVSWLSDPADTLVLFTSTSLKEARQRVWGSVIQYFTASALPLPGKVLDSIGVIRTHDGQSKFSDKCGMHLITGEKSKLKENIGKLIGLKNKKVILIGDELPELSPALVEAAKSNLISNPYFQMMGMGNFKSVYDPFGVESTPLNGWGSISTEDTRWETANGGICLRFDGLKSPNILCGQDRWPIYGNETLARQKKSMGEHTASFWRMCRSFPCPESDSDRIYSDADLIKGKVHDKAVWATMPVMGAALDPAFCTGGDGSVAYFGKCGQMTDGKYAMEVTDRVELREDLRKKEESRVLQVAKGFRDECVKRNIPPEMAAYDASGGGVAFGALLIEVWAPRIVAVQFGGMPSERIVNTSKGIKACDAYDRRVTELWFSGLEFVQSGQIRGMPVQVAKELKERRYVTVKAGTGLKTIVEPKKDMKSRIGFSPDDADSFLILLELFRVKLKFTAGGMMGMKAKASDGWAKKTKRINSIYSNVEYAPEEVAA